MACIGILGILLLLTIPVNTYKILVFNPRFGRSHVHFMGAVADVIAEAGHNVTVLMQIMNPTIPTNGSKLAKVITVESNDKTTEFFTSSSFMVAGWSQQIATPWGMLNVSREIAEAFRLSCEELLTNHKELLNKLKEERFDLAITEVFDACPVGLIEVLEIPAHILVSPSGLFDYLATIIGVPNFPSFVPSAFAWFSDQMTYFQRALNLVFFFISKNTFVTQTVAYEEALFRKIYDNMSFDFEETIAHCSFFICNTDPLFDYQRPLISKVIEMGGLGVPDVSPLNDYWSKVMTMREKVILVSFGSVIHSFTMPDDLKRTFLKTFDEFPEVTFIWKYEKEEDKIASGHPNVVTGTWLPQSDLLAHKNLVAFITHGGMNSITEVLNRGKPVIVIPVFGDQTRNGLLAERAGIGIMLSIPDLHVEGKLRNAIQRISTDTSYMIKAKEYAKMIFKRPTNPRDQLVKHVEFAAEFGRLPKLIPSGRKMSYISFYMLDVIIPFFLSVSLIAFAGIYFIYCIIRKYTVKRCPFEQKPKKQKKQ